MKVAYIVSLFPKISETFILREMQALRERGVEIVIISLKSRLEPRAHAGVAAFARETIYVDASGAAAGALLKRIIRQPLTTAALFGRVIAGSIASSPLDLLKSLPLIAVAARVAGQLRALGVDRVHAHWATYPALVAWAVGRFEGIPYSLTAHAHDIFGVNPILETKILGSDFTVTISEHNRRFLARRCGPEAASRVRINHCGVPLEEYPLRASPAGGSPRIVSIGRLVDYKGFTTLLRALKRLREEGREISCDIVGDGPLEPRLRAEMREMKLDGTVRILGAMTISEVKESLRSASACVLACERGRNGLMDGIPVVLMEAMALGVPAVSTRISGIPELIEDGTTGLLAEPGDPESLAKTMKRLFDDPALGARLVPAARARIEKEFDAARNAGALLDLFKSFSGSGST